MDTNQWSATLLALQQTVGTCWLGCHCLLPWQRVIVAHHRCRQKWPWFSAGHTKRSPLIKTITGQVRFGQQNYCNAYQNTSINLLIYFNNFIEWLYFSVEPNLYCINITGSGRSARTGTVISLWFRHTITSRAKTTPHSTPLSDLSVVAQAFGSYS